MNTLQIYDPPMCCSTGICGPSVDPDLVNFAGLLAQLGTHGVKIERYNLAQQPMAFAQNLAVKAMLEKEGAPVLPLIFLNGEVYSKERYPTREERRAFIHAALGEKAEVTS